MIPYSNNSEALLSLSRKLLSGHLTKLNQRLTSLYPEQHELHAEMQLVDRKINSLTQKIRSSLSGRAKWELGVEVQRLKNIMEIIKNEARDMDMVIKDYRNQQHGIWKKVIEDWEKQCEIWDEMNLS